MSGLFGSMNSFGQSSSISPFMPMLSTPFASETSYGMNMNGSDLFAGATFMPALLGAGQEYFSGLANASYYNGIANALGRLEEGFTGHQSPAVPEFPTAPETPMTPDTPTTPDEQPQSPDSGDATIAKNVIFMVPDGFSSAYADSYRIFKGGEEAPVWDDLLKGMVETSSADSMVTDSAAAATAYATGEKTNNGSVGVDANGVELASVLDLASDAGKATGIVSTAAITDATPAAFAASNVSRYDQTDIAQEYIQNGDLDVIMGGGRANFLTEEDGGVRTDNIDLTELAALQGFDYVTSADQLTDFDGDKLLGLFNDEDLSAPIGNGEIGERADGEPTLAEMTQVALDTLSKDEDGFFAVIEEEGTDTWGHQNDAATVMNAAKSFEDAMKVALEFSEEHPDTLVVAVGDHDTGGLAVEASDEANPTLFRQFDATVEQMESEFDVTDASSIVGVVQSHTGLELTDDEISRVQSTDDEDGLAQVLGERGGLAWTTTGHTGVDVQLYASGEQSDLFSGVMDNTEVANKLAQAMGLSLPADQSATTEAAELVGIDTLPVNDVMVA